MILEQALHPMIEEGVDEVVMGCTHYPFVIPLIKEIVGDQIDVIDPAPAVARQVGRLLTEYDLRKGVKKKGVVSFYTTGDTTRFDRLTDILLGMASNAQNLKWVGGDLQDR
jgi:glutamate racemase